MGHARQLDAVSRALLAQAARTGAWQVASLDASVVLRTLQLSNRRLLSRWAEGRSLG